MYTLSEHASIDQAAPMLASCPVVSRCHMGACAIDVPLLSIMTILASTYLVCIGDDPSV